MTLSRLIRQFKHRQRLVSSVLLGALAWWGLELFDLLASTRTILSLDLGGLCFLLLTWHMMSGATPAKMRRRAFEQDEGQVTILLLTVGAAMFSMVAIAFELQGLKELPAAILWRHLALAIGSIICAWLVTHTMFALHYAHGYYGDVDGDWTTEERADGLEFPNTPDPDYWDFIYYAFTVGMTAQTSDVQVASSAMRRLTLAHAVLSFVFNTVILALSVNIAAGLL